MGYVILKSRFNHDLYFCDMDITGFTDDLQQATIFETIKELSVSILPGEQYYPVIRDEEGYIIGIDKPIVEGSTNRS